MIIRDFASENVVAAELAHNDTGIANDFAGAPFDRLLTFGVAVEKVDGMLETRGSDVVEEAGEGLFAVVGEVPDDEGDTETMRENGIIIR